MASPVVVPRWVPSPRPEKSTQNDDNEEDDISSPPRDKALFPFSSFSSLQLLELPTIPSQPAEVQLTEKSVAAVGDRGGSTEFGTVMTQKSELKGENFGRYEASGVDGVFISWEDLWVTVPSGKNGNHPILQGLTGYAQAGEVLAIMGPGCGKSTFWMHLQARGSMLMFIAAFLTFMAIGGFPSFVEDMKIFGRERLNGHYGIAAFVFGNTFSSIPYLLLISLLPGAITYSLVGLQKGIDHFVYFALVPFTCMMLVEGLMMIVSSVVPDFLMGIITGAGIQGVTMLNGGFFRLPSDLPDPFWKYPMYYIAFHRYANQGFYKNEFEGKTFDSNQVRGSRISGENILRDTWQMHTDYSNWVDLFVLLGMVVLYRVVFFGIIKTAEKMKPIVNKNNG